MQQPTHQYLYSILFLYLSTYAAAWPWPIWFPEIDSLIVRQVNNDNTASPTPTASLPTATVTGTNSNTQTPNLSDTGSATGTAGVTSSGTNTADKSASTTTAHNSTEYDNRLPAGGVSMLTPAASLGQQYFKIGDFVTFGWNYTSLSATPTAVNVMATCTANKQLYTIGVNQTISNETNSIVWDTGAYQATAVQDPLLTQTYTLIIYDAESSISATARPGYLAVYNQYTFGMYTPQSYTPLGDFVCATCSGAWGSLERKALGMVLGMCAITVLSFSWFVVGFGVIW